MKCLYLTILLFFAVSDINASRKFFLGRRQDGLPIEEPVIVPRAISENWFNQTLDHFHPTDTRTWQQRYFVNDQTQDTSISNSAFLFIGGEGPASISWMAYGAWYTSARKYGALMFQLEHRYYGNSRPTEDLSLENLKYLTSEQGIADLATFIVAMNKEYNLPEDTKWILFGGSYSGSLAAWARFQYPHLVHGAMSASGPLLAEVDFIEYFQVVGNSLATHSSACEEAVKEGVAQVDSYLSDDVQGPENLTELFELCTPLRDSLNTPEDISTFYQVIADNFAGVVQYNLLSSPSISDVCDIMVDETLGEPIERLARVNILINGESCIDFRYKDTVDLLRDETFSDGMWRQWTYQTCTEFGFYQTSSYESHIFGDKFPVEYFIKLCQDIFGEEFDAEYVDTAIDHTNVIYGGKNIEVSNVVFVHGTIDPWSALGVTETVDEEAPAIFINGTAHCANMYPPLPNDPPGLTPARERVDDLIGTWLGVTKLTK